MTDLETVWRSRTDDRVIDAMASLDDFNPEARAVIQAEHARRGLPPPFVVPATSVDFEGVARAHRIFIGLVALQFGAFVGTWFVFDGGRPGLAVFVWMLVTLGTTIGVPVAGWSLFARIGVTPGLAVVTLLPLIGPLFALLFPYFAGEWARRNGLRVGLLGPTLAD
jgi:hypothetical protein